MPEFVEVRIKRQKDPSSEPYWEEFHVPYKKNLNVITLLQEIQRNPVNVKDEPTTPVAWDCSCLEEVCGACTMIMNGAVGQACTALVDKMEQPIILEPMRKFPVIRDLCVDRQRLFNDLKRVKAWVPIDGTYDLGPGPRISQSQQQEMYIFSRCMSCGCCLDACPQYTKDNEYVGAAVFGQTYLFNKNPTGRFLAEERLTELMGEGGIHECGNAQNCVRVCPKDIPLMDAIAGQNRATLIQLFKNYFNK
jgi:succinate dehydrogenase / fumarate reductase iron-sulfur subunit